MKPIANFMLAESPLCDLMPKADTEKAFLFNAIDLSEGEQVNEKFCMRFNTLEHKNEFKAKFDAAKEFNKMAKEGASPKELIWAEEVEDIEEKVEDDIDRNTMAAGADDE